MPDHEGYSPPFGPNGEVYCHRCGGSGQYLPTDTDLRAHARVHDREERAERRRRERKRRADRIARLRPYRKKKAVAR
jgi:hypothetical protein